MASSVKHPTCPICRVTYQVETPVHATMEGFNDREANFRFECELGHPLTRYDLGLQLNPRPAGARNGGATDAAT